MTAVPVIMNRLLTQVPLQEGDCTPQTQISSRSCVIHVWRCNLTQDAFCVVLSLFFLYFFPSFCSLFIPLPQNLVLASPWLYSWDRPYTRYRVILMLIHALYFNCRLPNSHVLFNYFQEHKTEIKITIFWDMMRCNLVELYGRYKHAYVKNCSYSLSLEQCDWRVSSPDSNLGNTGFKPERGGPLVLLIFFVIYFRPSSQIPGKQHKIDHNIFLPLIN